jgi:hypothetical protein
MSELVMHILAALFMVVALMSINRRWSRTFSRPSKDDFLDEDTIYG